MIDVLYIAEKPSLAQAIAEQLPGKLTKTRTHTVVGNTALVACRGHMLEQLMPEDYDPRFAQWNAPDLPIVPNEWRMRPRKGASETISTIKALLKEAKHVVHAGDPDQEGQLIVDEILSYVGNKKPVSRILVNDYNPAEVRKAIAAIAPNTEQRFVGWRLWAECRSRLDWLLGLNCTRAYTLRGRAGGYDGVLSVGRVQTPTLGIVVGRDEAIEGFKPIPFFAIALALESSGTEFAARWRAKAEQTGLDEAGRLVDSAVVAELVGRVQNAEVTVTKFEESEKRQGAPLPFSLKTLQMAANDHFGYTGDQTLEIAQALYETHKLTTYPRTDSQYLSLAQHAESPERLGAIANNLPELRAALAGVDRNRVSAAFDDSKVTAHHGIVPTAVEASTANLSEKERNLYTLICRAFVAQFHPAHMYMHTAAEFTAAGESFSANGRRTLVEGWKTVFKVVEDETAQDDVDDAAQSLPAMAVGHHPKNLGCKAASKKTTPPARFTDKTLLQAMGDAHKYVTNPTAKARLKEGQGIGTPATSAGIIKELVERGYLARKGKQLISTDTARILIHALPEVASDPGFTGLTEQTLDQVAAGSVSDTAFMSRCVDLVRNMVATAAVTEMKFPTRPCPVCKEGILRRRKKNGSTSYFWGCSRYQEGCKASYDDSKGAPRLVTAARKPATKKRSTVAKKATTKKAKV